jgi:molybdenum cofactor guanylyltransferase
LAGIVLAGGQSRRMGLDKALLVMDGVSLVERAARVVSEVVSPVFVVAGCADRYSISGMTVIGDDRPGEGPLGGIVSGLRRAGPGFHVVVACDMPLLSIAVLKLLLARSNGHDAAVPFIGCRPEPLCAVYGASCLEPFSRALDSGIRAVHKALESVTVARVEQMDLAAVDPRLESFANLNEPGDRERLGLDVEWSFPIGNEE